MQITLSSNAFLVLKALRKEFSSRIKNNPSSRSANLFDYSDLKKLVPLKKVSRLELDMAIDELLSKSLIKKDITGEITLLSSGISFCEASTKNTRKNVFDFLKSLILRN